VLDLTRARAGPTAARVLADWGADVIQIAAPPSSGKRGVVTGNTDGPDYQNLHRNKRSMTINLAKPDGRALGWPKRPTSSSRIIVPRSNIGSASTTIRSPRSIRASSTAASRVSGRAAPIAIVPVSTRSRRAWAD